MTTELINQPAIPTDAAGDITTSKPMPSATRHQRSARRGFVFPEPSEARRAEIRRMAREQAEAEAKEMVAQPGVCLAHDFELENMGDALEALRSGQIEPITC